MNDLINHRWVGVFVLCKSSFRFRPGQRFWTFLSDWRPSDRPAESPSLPDRSPRIGAQSAVKFSQTLVYFVILPMLWWLFDSPLTWQAFSEQLMELLKKKFKAWHDTWHFSMECSRGLKTWKIQAVSQQPRLSLWQRLVQWLRQICVRELLY